MKSLALATLSALSLALVTPAFACPGAKNMQNADAGTVQSEKSAEAAAAAQTPMPDKSAAAALSAEVAAAPSVETATTKN